MKQLTTAGVIALSLAISGTATADIIWGGHRQDVYEDTAQVLKVKPIYETVTTNHPREQCWNEKTRKRHHRHDNDSYTGTVLGAIVGGVVGNQFGHNSGKKAMTVAGSLLGATIGHDLSRSNRHRDHRPGYRYEQRCEIVDDYQSHEEMVAYRVKYRYKGRVYRTRMRNDPGDTIRVRVDLTPMEY